MVSQVMATSVSELHVLYRMQEHKERWSGNESVQAYSDGTESQPTFMASSWMDYSIDLSKLFLKHTVPAVDNVRITTSTKSLLSHAVG